MASLKEAIDGCPRDIWVQCADELGELYGHCQALRMAMASGQGSRSGAGYGDFVAGILAIIATIALAKHASSAIAAVWVFNVWGAADLLFAFYSGLHAQLQPGTLGAAFYLLTAIVPPLLVSHFLVFRLLVRRTHS